MEFDNGIHILCTLILLSPLEDVYNKAVYTNKFSKGEFY